MSKIITKYSDWLRFYRCPACDHADEKSALCDPTGPCPKCGDDHLQFLIGRWKMEEKENALWEDLCFVLQPIKFTAEFR